MKFLSQRRFKSPSKKSCHSIVAFATVLAFTATQITACAPKGSIRTHTGHRPPTSANPLDVEIESGFSKGLGGGKNQGTGGATGASGASGGASANGAAGASGAGNAQQGNGQSGKKLELSLMTSEELRAAGQDMAGVPRTVSDSELAAKREERVAQVEQEEKRQEQRQQDQDAAAKGAREKAAAASTDQDSKGTATPTSNTATTGEGTKGAASEEITTIPVGGPVLVDDDWSGIEDEAQSLVPQASSPQSATATGAEASRSPKKDEQKAPLAKKPIAKKKTAAKKAEKKKALKPQAVNSPAQKAKPAVTAPHAPAKKVAAPAKKVETPIRPAAPARQAVAPAKALKAPAQRAAAPAPPVVPEEQVPEIPESPVVPAPQAEPAVSAPHTPAPVAAAPEAAAATEVGATGQADAPFDPLTDEIQGLLAARDARNRSNDRTSGEPETAAASERTGVGEGTRDTSHGDLPDVFQSFNTEVCEKLSLAGRELRADVPALQRYGDQLPLSLPADYYRGLEPYARKHGLAMNPVQLLKNHFVCTLLPIAVRMNTQVFRQRLEVVRLQTRDKWGALTAEDKAWLDELKTSYRLPTSASYEQLLERVDVVPIPLLLGQGSWESHWGNSELARGANNLFGMKAAKGQPSFSFKKVSWRRFDNLSEGIAGYIELLNTGPYRHYRAARAKMRTQGQKLDSLALVASLKLDGYAQDPAYVQKISGAIRDNGFKSHELVEKEIALREGERPSVKIGDQQRVAQ